MFLARLVVVCVFCLWLTGCGHKGQRNTVAVGDGNEKDTTLSVPGAGKVVFEKEDHNFGQIIQGEEVSVRFYFTNVGRQPLLIEEVISGCGCTQVKYPKEPIMPEERKWVEVIFNSGGRKGLQYQSVGVRFGEVAKSIRLTIVARVREN